MKIIPAIDLKDNKCVRLTQGKEKSSTIYNQNPIAQAKFFEEQGCKKIHIIDLDAAFGRLNVNTETIIKIKKSVNIPIQLGGGIRSREDIIFWLENDIDNLIIGSMAVKNSELVKKIVNEFEHKIYIALDVIDGKKIMINGWTQASNLSLQDVSNIYKNFNIKGYILTSINHDGMMQGPSLSFYKDCDIYNKPLIFSGGYSSYENLELLSLSYFKKKDYFKKNGEIEGVIIGKAFYSGVLEIKKAIESLKKYA